MITEEDEGSEINLLVMKYSALEDGLFMGTLLTSIEPVVPTCPKGETKLVMVN